MPNEHIYILIGLAIITVLIILWIDYEFKLLERQVNMLKWGDQKNEIKSNVSVLSPRAVTAELMSDVGPSEGPPTKPAS